jgi:hypothetical protein
MKNTELKIGKTLAIIVYTLLYLLVYNIFPESKKIFKEYNFDECFLLSISPEEYNKSKSEEIYPQNEELISSLNTRPLSSVKTYSCIYNLSSFFNVLLKL